jgi:hypothetical protein
MSIIGMGPSPPGISLSVLATWMNEFWWGGVPNPYYVSSGQIVSTAVDAGNTPTTTLRAGLLMGRVDSSGKYKEWNPLGTDGSERIAGILVNSVSTLDASATAADKYVGWIMTRGHVRATKLVVPGAASASIIGSHYEYQIRRQLERCFNLDDAHLVPCLQPGETVRPAAADLTVTYAMNGTKFSTIGASGAIIFTLPALPYKGLIYEFVNEVDQNMSIVAATADTITVDGNLTADSVIYSTASHKIGAHARVEGLTSGLGTAANGRWLVTNLSTGCTMTVVDA